jgi:CHAT domain-containing protein/Tfp pilus assembly protein PilF
MRARGISIPAAAVSIILLSSVFTASANHSLCAQQPATTASASPSSALPAEVQAKLDKLQADLKAAKAAGDARTDAETLDAIGDLYLGVSAYQQAMDSYNQAQTQARIAKDVPDEAAALNGIGDCYRIQAQNDQALETYQHALDAATSSGDLREQAAALNGIGWVNANTGRLQQALEFSKRALPLAQKAGDEGLEATILRRIGGAYWGLGESQSALDYYDQALPLTQKVGDHIGEARTLNNLGIVTNALGQKSRALEYYGQALSVYRQMGDRNSEAGTLNNVAIDYQGLGELQKSLTFFEQALVIRHAIGDTDGEAATLNNIGLDYWELGDFQQALQFSGRAIPLYRQAGDRDGEAGALTNLGLIYKDLGEYRKALEFLNQALPIRREIGDKDGEAGALDNMANAYFGLGEWENTLQSLNQALPILQEIGDRDAEAEVLSDMADVFRGQGDTQRALDSSREAFLVAAATGNPLLESEILHSLMLILRKQQPGQAILYGKEAVNLVQQVRGNVQGLNKELQKSFLASKGDYYHDLADLLISEGRLPEAQQVLDLLKQQEYQDYVRGDTANTLSPLTLTPAEKQAADDYQNSTEQLVSLGEQWSALKKISTRTPEQEQQYQQLSQQLDAASKGLNDYYTRLYALFGSNGEANKQVADVKGDVSLLKQTIARMPHTVALYTLVGKERYSVIVITGTTAVAREYAITEKDLNQKVAAFQQALRDPHNDAQPLAQELYKILIGPVKADLDQAQAQTLVWSLDGVLRYVPMAALFDGKHYLVEKYSTVTITPVSIPHLTEKPDFSNLSAAAMGISRKYEDGLPALPAVVGELDEVVNDAQAKGAQGVLPGTILLNSAFTEKAMETLLSNPHTVVHIASHFVFKPGDDSQSYLLLAGRDQDTAGYHMTVADFRDNQNLSLDETDLLTLSACETGMSGSANNGREVDGLGTTAQLKGAKAVISSLWEVNDASTGQLMADFYKRWAEGAGKVSKAEALRQAQLDLLQGKVTPQSATAGRGFAVAQNESGSQAAPAGYAHPYYWAPFVLMGNWR